MNILFVLSLGQYNLIDFIQSSGFAFLPVKCLHTSCTSVTCQVMTGTFFLKISRGAAAGFR
jgi:hypothetical protein